MGLSGSKANSVGPRDSSDEGDTWHEQSSWNLRFHGAQAETGYVRLKHEGVFTSLRWTSGVVALTASFQMVQLLAMRGWQAEDFEVSGQHTVHLVQVSMMTILALLMVFFIVLSKLFAGKLAKIPRTSEILGCVLVSYIMTSAVFTDRWYLAKLLGFEPEAWEGDLFSDTRVLLALDAMLSFTHLFCDIRWCIMLSVEIFTVLLYAFLALGLGSSEGNLALNNLILLMALVIGSALGKRSVERTSREAFAKVAQERSLRVMAEAQAQAGSSTDQRYIAASEVGSADMANSVRPSTAPTDRLFVVDPESGAENVGDRLEDIASVGKREKWLLDARDVQLDAGTVLGEGGFGMVISGAIRGTEVAVKVPKDPSDTSLVVTRHLASLANELRLLRLLRHPNIVVFYGACVVDVKSTGLGVFGASGKSYLALVLERVDGVPLSKYICKGWPKQMIGPSGMPDDSARLGILLGTCRALQYLHSLVPIVIHGDLKPSNILIESTAAGLRAKLVDFGLACKITRRQKTLGGTLSWMAPEVVSQRRPCSASDVFSFGRLMYFVVCGQAPLDGYSPSSILKSLRSSNMPPLTWPEKAEPTEPVKRLINECSFMAIRDRPTIEDVAEQLQRLCSLEALSPEASASSSELTLSTRRTELTMDFHTAVLTASRPKKEPGSRKHAIDAMPRVFRVPQGTLVTARQPTARTGSGTLQAVAEEPGNEAAGKAPDANEVGKEIDGALFTTKVHPRLDVTPDNVRELTLVDLMIRWNVEFATDSCCRYHALLSKLRETAHRLSRMKCKHEFLVQVGNCTQCSGCQTVKPENFESERCDFCGEELPPPQPLEGVPAAIQLPEGRGGPAGRTEAI